MSDPVFDRTKLDRLSRTWETVEAWARDRRRKAVAITLARGLSPTQTEFERGAVAVLTELLALADPLRAVDAANDTASAAGDMDPSGY